ncbi:MAG TPA: hypothetical protein VFC92_01765 [Bacteroidales bacterium]|nr:hypothetical protein [Bacteroidales bacterium]
MKVNQLLIFLFTILLSACGGERSRLDIDTRDIEIKPVRIERYEKALFEIAPDSMQAQLKAIAPEFPVFLDADLDDTLNIMRLHEFITDPLNYQLYEKTLKVFPDLTPYECDFTEAFKRFRYFFPDRALPDIFSYVSGLLYENPVQFFNEDMIIALDMYLGTGLETYRKMRLPLYAIRTMTPEYLVRDGIHELYLYHFALRPGTTFLEQAIDKGRQLWFLDAMLPATPDSIKIGFTLAQLEWCRQNEANIWSFIIQNDLLYSSETHVLRKFFADGPFTSDFSTTSPPRIGEWVGWQIVRSFMKKNKNVSPEELFINTQAQDVLKNSGYKPRGEVTP